MLYSRISIEIILLRWYNDGWKGEVVVIKANNYELESYLQSKDEKYYVCDYNLENAEIVVFQPYPTSFDLKEKLAVSSLKTWHGQDLFGEKIDCDEKCIGTAYISNVPLYGTDEDTYKMVGDFDGIIHCPSPLNSYLRSQFSEKMKKIIENPKTKLIAYKLEMFTWFYNDFCNNSDVEIINKLNNRINEGSLKILPFPQYRIDQIRTFEKCYNDFKDAFDEIIK